MLIENSGIKNGTLTSFLVLYVPGIVTDNTVHKGTREIESTVPTVRARGAIYKAVVQLVTLYESKSWVMTKEMLNILAGFRHQAAQRITGMTAKRRTSGECEYPR